MLANIVGFKPRLFMILINLAFSIFTVYLVSRLFILTAVEFVVISVLFFVISSWLTKSSHRRSFHFCFPLLPAAIFIAYFTVWYQRTFGGFDLGAIMFHLHAGFGDRFDLNSLRRGLRYFVFASVTSVLWMYLLFNFKRLRIFDLTLALTFLLATPLSRTMVEYVQFMRDDVALLDFHARPEPVYRGSPTQYKNLLIIYAESTERTFGQLKDGPEIFADMNFVSSLGAEVVGVEQVSNTGWSVAGLVASQCGVPLQPSRNFFVAEHVEGSPFLHNVKCLGDVVSPHGYSLEYVSGGDLSFAGMKSFLHQHKYSGVYDVHDLIAKDSPYQNLWGAYDDTMFGFADQRLKFLQTSGRPFVLSMATIAGHARHGFPSQECIRELSHAGLAAISFAIKCTGYHIRTSLEKWKAEGLLDNTIVVVMSDHLMMLNGSSDELLRQNRQNYLALFGDGIGRQVIVKQSATFDVFPTLLEILGFELHEHQAGIGRSLLSERPSLVEEIGIQRLNAAITHDRAFSEHLWADAR